MPGPEGGFQHLPRDLANVNVLENNVWSLLLHNFNEMFGNIAKNVALYFVNVWQSTPDCRFLLISVCLAREHQSIQDGRHRPIRPWCSRKGSFFKTRWSPTSALVQMICKFINKKEICLPLYAIISMQINPNTFLCHPAVLDCRNLFLS